MARAVPPERFGKLIEAATKVFVERGYRQTQMSEVADALGLAKGTLYGYVESKESLFDAAVRFSDQVNVTAPERLPLPTPPLASTANYIRDRLASEASELRLVAALAHPPAKADRAREFESIVRDLYRRMSRNRRAIKLVDRCAPEHPELAAVWFQQGRWAQVELLAEYVRRRSASGYLREVPSIPLAARMMLETITLWAVHMPWDPAPRAFGDHDVEDAVVDLVVHAYIKESRR